MALFDLRMAVTSYSTDIILETAAKLESRPSFQCLRILEQTGSLSWNFSWLRREGLLATYNEPRLVIILLLGQKDGCVHSFVYNDT